MRSVSEANRQKQEKKQRNLAQAGRQVRIAGAFLLLIMLLLLSLIWSICSGSVSVPIMEFLQELREPKLRGMAWTIIWEIRLPRALAALILGGALALSGYLLQTAAAVFLLSKPIGAYPMGETYAKSMGVNVAHLRFFMVILSSILSGCVAAFAGPVSFVGIAVPHLIRWLFADTRPLVLIPGCFLGGSVFCLFSDWLARTVFAPTELSISTVTAVFGAPVVIFVMMRKHRKST